MTLIEVLPIALMFLLLFGGMPVAFALGISGAVGIYSVIGWNGMLGAMSTIPYRTTASYTMVAIGMFILMAEIATQSNITARLFNAANSLVGHIRGGLGLATVLATAAFSTLSGSSIAATATLSRVAVPEMLRRGYPKPFAAGCVAVSGTLAILIPPSLPLIIYGILTETSIRMLLIAGFVPGLITMFANMIVVFFWFGRDKALEVQPRKSAREKWQELKYVWPFILVVVLIFAGLYSGAVTTTEASALGVTAMFFVWVVLGRLRASGMTPFSFSGLRKAFDRALSSTVMIIALLIGAYIFSFYLTVTGATQSFGAYIDAQGLSPLTLVIVLIALNIVLGMFMSQLEIMILTLPFIFPIMMSAGFDSLWLAIIVIKTIEIGLITPPVGMNVFVVASTSRVVSPMDGFRGAMPFLVADLAVLALFVSFPEIILFLPAMVR